MSAWLIFLQAQISNGYEYIATATTANNPEIKIWRADAGK